jgi:hypothetical protein
MVLTRQLHDAAGQALSHVIFVDSTGRRSQTSDTAGTKARLGQGPLSPKSQSYAFTALPDVHPCPANGASNVKATIRHDLSLNPVQLRFVWRSVAPVLRSAAGVRRGPSAVESQGHRQQKFNPFYVSSHWHRFGGRARLSRLPGV